MPQLARLFAISLAAFFAPAPAAEEMTTARLENISGSGLWLIQLVKNRSRKAFMGAEGIMQ